MANGGWLKVLAVVISILAVVMPPLGYVIHQQDQIKDNQRDLRTEIKILKDRLAWSGVIPTGTHTLEKTEDWIELAKHIRMLSELEEPVGIGIDSSDFSR